MGKLNNLLGKLVSKKVVVVIVLVLYMLALVAYDVIVYKRDMFNMMTGYIGAVIMMAIVFTVVFLMFKMVKDLKDNAAIIVCVELVLTIITGVSFITSGFLVLSFIVPTALMATVCGLRA